MRSCAGLAVSLGYQALYTVPRWRRLVGAHLAATGTSGAQALGLLAGFGAFYNIHNIAQVPKQRRTLFGVRAQVVVLPICRHSSARAQPLPAADGTRWHLSRPEARACVALSRTQLQDPSAAHPMNP